MNVLSLFDGISCGQQALKNLAIPISNYYASEIEHHAIAITQKNHPYTIQLGDVKSITASQVPKIDLLLGGFPCQAFSIAGKKMGFSDDRGMLFYEAVRLLGELKPSYFLFENVIMKQEIQDEISRLFGVHPILINSDRFVQQNRPRLYWTNIPTRDLPARPNWQGDYYQWRHRERKFRKNQSGVCPCLAQYMGTGGHNVPLRSENLADKLTINELEVLQGLPKDYTAGVSNSSRLKAIGNGWTVDVIAHIFRGLSDEIAKFERVK